MSARTLLVADRVWGHESADAVLVDGERIAAVGDAAALMADAAVVRVRGTVLPGLVDAHTHPLMGAELARGVDLTKVSTVAQLRDALADAARRIAAGDWLLGWGLEHGIWGGADPCAADIDDVAPDLPIALRMFDAHSMLVSSAGLRAAGIDRGVTFDTGSRIAVDASGAPTGFVLEMEAMDLVERALPPETRATVRDRLADVLNRMRSSGLVGAHVMDARGDALETYAALETEDRLPIRLRIHPWITPTSTRDEWEAIAETIGEHGDRWSIHGVKLFVDGTIDNGTAWLREPDRDGASIASAWPDPSRYVEAVRFFAERGVGTATHAIGDAAVLHAADAIRTALSAHPGGRHRIEHLELTGDDVVERVQASGAIASMQPTHCTHFVHADGSDNWSARIGDRRAHAWRSRSLADLGVPLALGSDWPIADFPPLPIVAAAALRRPAGVDREPVLPAEAVEVRAAIEAYTTGAAVAVGAESDEGMVAAGFRADLTIVDADPLAVDADTLAGARIVATMVDGGLVRHD